MAIRTTHRDQPDDEAAQNQRAESDRTDDRGTETVSRSGEQAAQPAEGAPEGFQDFGRALQEQIAQALQPAVAEFREQMEQTVREQMAPNHQPPGNERQQEAQPTREPSREEPRQSAPEPSRDELRQSARPSVQPPPPEPSRDEPRDSARPSTQQPTERSEESAQPPNEDRNQQPDEESARRPRQDRSGERRQLARTERRPAPRRPGPGEVFDPRGAARAGLLRVARSWREAGSTYQAIHAYTQILIRYPGGGAASAATEELIQLAETLVQQGRYYSALNVFDKLEQLL